MRTHLKAAVLYVWNLLQEALLEYSDWFVKTAYKNELAKNERKPSISHWCLQNNNTRGANSDVCSEKLCTYL
jgi:hypothetical protein